MIEINGEKSVTLTAKAYLELEVEYKGKKHLLNEKSDIACGTTTEACRQIWSYVRPRSWMGCPEV
jgi:hypothetical protein